MIVQSKELTDFYIAYNEWLETGAPDEKPFYRECGLCWNLIGYSHSCSIGIHDFILYNEMKQQFRCAGVDSSYPFGGQRVFDKETYAKTMHVNPDRIKWVKDHIITKKGNL